MEGSVRKPKVQTFDPAIYKTDKALRQHLESFVVKLNEKTEYARSAGVTFGALLDRYIDEEMPQRKSTKGGYLSIINSKLRPQWAPCSCLRYGPLRFILGCNISISHR